MIASVVATLVEPVGNLPDIIEHLAKLPGVEIGQICENARRVPITIDLPDVISLENTTRCLQECSGVALVDVVFVHYEAETESAASISREGTHEP